MRHSIAANNLKVFKLHYKQVLKNIILELVNFLLNCNIEKTKWNFTQAKSQNISYTTRNSETDSFYIEINIVVTTL